METRAPLIFKIANEDWEIDLIHQLNYKTFVEEIPQHAPSASQRLVDRFHAENTYLICLSGRKLVGMLAARANRPFSLDQKMSNLDSYLPLNRSLCEIRLLSVDKKYRTGQVFQGLLSLIWQHFVENGYDMGIISGTTRQLKLYKHLGFIPFGPLVGPEGAQYQPMYLSIESFEAGVREFLSARAPRHVQRPTVNFLPGPVALSRNVRRAFEAAPESHRSEGFVTDFQATKQILCELTGAKNMEILLGSGTLANDAVAAQLSLEQKPGLIVTNGEFGERLVDHARRQALDFELVQYPWGKSFDLELIKQRIAAVHPSWLWCVHCETSAGLVNNLEALKRICAEHNVKLCVDAISSIGTLPVNLEGVFLASCSSGKGLRSFPGLGMVFFNHQIEPSTKLPRYLDLGLYAKNLGVAFTHSSNLLYALNAAVKKVNWAERFSLLSQTSAWLRSKLKEIGFNLLAEDHEASSAVVSISLPSQINSLKVGAQLQEAGFLLSYNSDYLRRHNLIQICIMGEFTQEKLVSLLNHLNRICFRRTQSTPTPNVPIAGS
ncbi:aminotransferase class V-fold PLP-dependent enzyme [Pedosphaera parvula]|uniref:Aminotransferase class V n=1 Tax=Pedosphaera parvula (strain Ellin514) TaxID=320771 RepID=B9XGN4_PEDPL|nr:aminotransferase class V-fold PLP-dependent enzyme [Pedosphaera parvula]EEF61085.1 aminotransferase class V [Pedosphaera parvula Ellin514]